MSEIVASGPPLRTRALTSSFFALTRLWGDTDILAFTPDVTPPDAIFFFYTSVSGVADGPAGQTGAGGGHG